MTRALHRSFLAALLLAALGFIGGTGRASAQMANACCTFRIVISNMVPNACMPISVTTNWGGTSQTDIVTVKGTGNPPLSITAPCSAPPGPSLNWVSLDGGTTKYFFPTDPPGTGYKVTLPCGFCVTLNVITESPSGCLVVNLAGFCD